MTPLRTELLTELFSRAGSERLGIVVDTTNADALVVNLNVHRQTYNLYQYTICRTPDVNTIFIIKRSAELDP